MKNQNGKIQFIPLVVNLLITVSIGLAGGLLTVSSVRTWYPGLAKPAFNPPNWLFGPIWSVLFIAIGIAAYRIWIKREQIAHFPRTIAIYAIQLILNLCWSYLFFYHHLIGAALFEIVALLIAILVNGLIFYKIDKIAGLIFIPYFLWVSFAALLTYNIYILNSF
ncbi:TspO/MBR family protein [Pedobacter antarcticus]|uniref:TspO and MBR n=2 Tax=Pedobacter antarcticus TaxID=34086 RepID=A0A081PFX3_9SPHI|nr:TspO/MBR family protein [Pedobacter antarcticus]KEQ29596.1 TspO and MBR [Pedobacter antarcticus 4BY]SDM39031.1 TspO and MBR related proteins [Pedobacter antarcticus]SFE93584.1 TspO and MBR related proteins [Pedobacter antarcticus]